MLNPSQFGSHCWQFPKVPPWKATRPARPEAAVQLQTRGSSTALSTGAWGAKNKQGHGKSTRKNDEE